MNSAKATATLGMGPAEGEAEGAGLVQLGAEMASVGPNCSPPSANGEINEPTEPGSSVVHSRRTRRNGHELEQDRTQSKTLPPRMVQQWSRLPTGVVGSPSSEV